MKKYVYPCVALKPSQDLAFFRMGGPGLANCMYVAARAAISAKKDGLEMLRPTWERFGIGQFIRREKDKRFYAGLFKGESFWATLRRLWIIKTSKQVQVEDGLGHYFEDLLDDWEFVKEYFRREIEPCAVASVPIEMKKSVAVHVRLGDFPDSLRVSPDWYVKVLKQVREAVGHEMDVQIFSDGTDEELGALLKFPGARRVFYGNALADIVAISRCGLLVGSHSTFSGWGAYLGQVPSVFKQIDYGRVLKDLNLDLRIGEEAIVPREFLDVIKERLG